MKCVQSVVNAKIKRVPDDKAERMVASKSWFYVPKWQYKGKEPVFKELVDYDNKAEVKEQSNDSS
jgi:hypothetical protein|tara:strand:+ start:159 stop:353 length:195 start_codon:yes stop_codon:yes gene_type:complete